MFLLENDYRFPLKQSTNYWDDTSTRIEYLWKKLIENV